MESPYREGQPLRDVIPPDRRRQRAATLVFAGMVAGATLFCAARWLLFRDAEGTTDPMPPIATPRPPSTGVVAEPRELTPEEAERVVTAHRSALREACWDRPIDPRVDHAKISLSIVVGESGSVVSATATGDAPLVGSCIETQARGWQFPATGTRRTIQVPLVFTRQ